MVKLQYGHMYCAGCAKGLFMRATKDESLFPLRCCKVPIDPKLGHPVHVRRRSQSLRVGQPGACNRQQDILQRALVWKVHPTYSNHWQHQRGGVWRMHQHHLCRLQGSIPRGRRLSRRPSIAPDASTCSATGLANLPFLQVSGPAPQWMQPYDASLTIWRVNDLPADCLSRCRCKAESCYRCGVEWKNCPCAVADEHRMLERAEEVVDRDAAPGLAPAERHQRVRRVEAQLMEHHECDHPGRFQRIFGGGRQGFQCELCDDHHRKYILRCRHCFLEVCEDCRRNRI